MAINDLDVLEVVARLEYGGGEDVVGVYQFRSDNGATVPDASGITDMTEFLEILYTILLASLSVVTVFRDIRIRNVTQDTLLGTFAWPTLTVGGAGSETLPHAVSAMVSFPSSVPKVTMRKYLPRLTEPSLETPGVWTSVALGVLATYGATLLAQVLINGRAWQYGYLSPKTSTFVVPTSALVTNVPAYQRRRKPGRGS